MSNPYDQNPEQNPYGQNPDSGNYYGQPGGYQPTDPNQGGYGQNPYGQPYPQYGAVGPQPHPQGTTVLVLGILGLVVCFIVGIFGLVMGNRVLKEIDANPGAYNNRQNVVIGRVLSIIGIAWQGLFTIGYIIFFIALVASSGTS
jgi:hypothetical protein